MTSRAPAATKGEADPFVPISKRQRLLVVAVFALFLILVLLARSNDPTPVGDWIPTYLTLYVALLAAPFVLFRGAGWFHPVTFVALTSFVPLIQRFSVYGWGLDWHQVLPYRREELSELIEFQLLLNSLAIVSFYAGFFLTPKLPTPRFRFVDEPPGLVRKLILFSAFSFLVFVIFLAARGGLDAHIAGWARGRHAEFTGQHYKVALMSLGGLCCWIWLAFRRNALTSPAFWVCTGIALVIAFLSMGSRSSAIYPVFIGLIIWMLRERRVVYLPVFVGLLAAIYVVGALGAFRRSGWEGETRWDAATDVGVVDTITGGAEGEIARRSSSGDVALAIFARVPDDVPLLWGTTYLEALSAPIPRALWPGKPGQVGGMAGRVFFGMQAGVPPGAVGEAYWNFHIPGVIVVFLLFGMFQNWMARTYRRNADHRAAIVLYGSSLFLCSTPATAAFVGWIIPTSSLLFVFWILGILRLRRAQPTALHLRPTGLGA